MVMMKMSEECGDLNCRCDEGDFPIHESSVMVPFTVLHQLASEADKTLVFLPGSGGIWIGEDVELSDLVDQLEEAEEAECKQMQQLRAQHEAAMQSAKPNETQTDVQPEKSAVVPPCPDLDAVIELQRRLDASYAGKDDR
jgi:hypothetical protein